MDENVFVCIFVIVIAISKQMLLRISAKRRGKIVIGDDSYLFPTLRDNDNGAATDDEDNCLFPAVRGEVEDSITDDGGCDDVHGDGNLLPAVRGEVEDEDGEEGDAHARDDQIHLQMQVQV